MCLRCVMQHSQHCYLSVASQCRRIKNKTHLQQICSTVSRSCFEIIEWCQYLFASVANCCRTVFQMIQQLALCKSIYSLSAKNRAIEIKCGFQQKNPNDFTHRVSHGPNVIVKKSSTRKCFSLLFVQKINCA